MHESPETNSGVVARRVMPSVGVAGEAKSIRVPLRKRMLDLGLGFILIVVTTPIVFVLAIGSLVSYRSWPIFVHERVGMNGRVFRLAKIRSLPVDVPSYVGKEELGKFKNNKWGRFLRKHHLDELPQFWHVIARRMSLVGPRPEMLQLTEKLPKEFIEKRLSVLPGCTGLWQITSASAEKIGKSPQFDMYYVDNWTLRLDLWILYMTIGDLVRHSLLDSIESIPRWTKPNPFVSTSAQGR